MGILPDLSERDLSAEEMDDPALAAEDHRAALRGLSRLNRISRADRLLWEPIRTMAQKAEAPTLRILDIATGSGDLPVALAQRAQRTGIAVEIVGCDSRELAVTEASTRAAHAGARAEFFRLDIVQEEIPPGYDIIMCSLFLHHLTLEQTVDLLYRMKAAAQRMVLISDLRRCRAGYLGALLASRVLTRSHIVHGDALKSVRAAFTEDEFAVLAAEAGLHGATLECHWPWRMVLQWRRQR